MTRLVMAAGIGVLALVDVAALAGTAAGAAPTVTLVKAALAPEAKNDERTVMVPEAGQTFLWVTATVADAPATIDLTKVSVTSGTATFPLIGADSVWDGDPKQFSMIAPVHLKSGKLNDPLEESRSVGAIGFAFTPGKAATLMVNTPPQSFCLFVRRPEGLQDGEDHGPRRGAAAAACADRGQALTSAVRVSLAVSLAVTLIAGTRDLAASQPAGVEYRVVFASRATARPSARRGRP